MSGGWRFLAGVTTLVALGFLVSLAPASEEAAPERTLERCSDAPRVEAIPAVRAWSGEPKMGDLPGDRSPKRAGWPGAMDG
jgi:hypothetical protein